MEKLYKVLIIILLSWAILSTTGMSYYFYQYIQAETSLVTMEYKLQKYQNVLLKMNDSINALSNTLSSLNQSYHAVIEEYQNVIRHLQGMLNKSVAILVIDYGNGTRDIIKVEFVPGTNDTVFDILTSVAKVKYTYYESVGDVFIECINGVCNRQVNSNSGYYWLFYINFESSSLGAMHAKVVDGDIIIWNYTLVSW